MVRCPTWPATQYWHAAAGAALQSTHKWVASLFLRSLWMGQGLKKPPPALVSSSRGSHASRLGVCSRARVSPRARSVIAPAAWCTPRGLFANVSACHSVIPCMAQGLEAGDYEQLLSTVGFEAEDSLKEWEVVEKGKQSISICSCWHPGLWQSLLLGLARTRSNS
ncbi:MAG: hypothetical protein J3K34DRAFT_414062 [Monoraphidium minutum]|nr:MAG: hypothetical protein J3K34DRAFT_414062 [Monoraphidium minutum]